MNGVLKSNVSQMRTLWSSSGISRVCSSFDVASGWGWVEIEMWMGMGEVLEEIVNFGHVSNHKKAIEKIT